MRDSGLKMPLFTERVLTIWQPLINRPALAILAILVLIIVNAIVLFALGRSTYKRIAREIWSGNVVAIPLAFVLLSGVAMIHPYQKMYSALMTTDWVHEQAKSEEGQRLQGAWKLVRLEREGEIQAVGQDSVEILRVDAEGYRWRKAKREETGTLQLDLSSIPKRMQLYSTSHADLGVFRNAIYKIENAQLTLCLPQANPFGDDLLIQFETRGTKNELWRFEITNVVAVNRSINFTQRCYLMDGSSHSINGVRCECKISPQDGNSDALGYALSSGQSKESPPEVMRRVKGKT